MLVTVKTPAQKLSKRLVSIKFSQLIIEDLVRDGNVKKLELKKGYLLNSYIVNLVASWQTFIEDLLQFAVNDIVAQTSNEILKTIIKNNLEEKTKKFNTPDVKNIDALFKSVV